MKRCSHGDLDPDRESKVVLDSSSKALSALKDILESPRIKVSLHMGGFQNMNSKSQKVLGRLSSKKTTAANEEYNSLALSYRPKRLSW